MINIKDEIDIKIDELSAYIDTWLNSYKLPEQKFILLGHYRSGTTLLSDLLNSHPNIYCDGEIFLPFVKQKFKKVFLPYTYIKYHAAQTTKSIYGFDLKIVQLIEIIPKFQGSPEQFLLKLHKEGWKILYLKRLNILRQAISNIIAQSRCQWHDRREEPLHYSQVSINLERLMKEIRYHENNLKTANNILEQLPYLEINYEDNLLEADNHQATLDKIFDYLEVESVSVKTKLRKISGKDLSKDIKNYQKLVDFIQTTDYANLLEIN